MNEHENQSQILSPRLGCSKLCFEGGRGGLRPPCTPRLPAGFTALEPWSPNSSCSALPSTARRSTALPASREARDLEGNHGNGGGQGEGGYLWGGGREGGAHLGAIWRGRGGLPSFPENQQEKARRYSNTPIPSAMTFGPFQRSKPPPISRSWKSGPWGASPHSSAALSPHAPHGGSAWQETMAARPRGMKTMQNLKGRGQHMLGEHGCSWVKEDIWAKYNDATIGKEGTLQR